MAMRVPPVETKRKPRNSAMSLSAFDDLMNAIVAVRAGCCLGTLVPIWGPGADEEHQHAYSGQSLPGRAVASSDSRPQLCCLI
jgi:hypothetical protein